MALLTDDDRAHFEEYGYVVVEDVVPEEKCEAVIEDIYEFTGRDPDDPDTWYQPPEGLDEQFSSVGGLEMYNTQSMWDTRQDETLYQAFAEILEEEHLWVSIDRTNMTPPADEDHPEIDNALGVHWDTDVSDLPEITVQSSGTGAVPWGVQGVLHLADTAEEQGGFTCYPGVYRDIVGLAEEAGGDLTVEDIDLDDYELVKASAEQGDLLIWDRLLLHGNGRNLADRPRFAQYILMYPERFADVDARRDRIRTWKEREAIATPGDGDPRDREKEHPPADLTPLGRKLLGLDPWSGWSG
jgi:hypothetical protein